MSEDTNVNGTESNKGIMIDFENLSSVPTGPTRVVNVEEDAWDTAAPPPHDIYCLKPHIAKNGGKILLAGTKDSYGNIIKENYFTLNIEHRIISESDPDVHMIPVFQNLSSKFGRGKNISTAIGFLRKLGIKVPSPIDDKTLLELLKQALSSERILFGEVDWRGSYQDSDGSWQNTHSSMSDFPKHPERKGEWLHKVRVTKKNGTPAEVQAQTTVKALYSKKEYKELSESGQLNKIRASFGIGVAATNTSQLAEEEEVVAVPNGVIKPPVEEKKKKKEEVPVEVTPAKLAMALVEDE